jgi:hypothetical protein
VTKVCVAYGAIFEAKTLKTRLLAIAGFAERDEKSGINLAL